MLGRACKSLGFGGLRRFTIWGEALGLGRALKRLGSGGLGSEFSLGAEVPQGLKEGAITQYMCALSLSARALVCLCVCTITSTCAS